jgi:hypothetical protein
MQTRVVTAEQLITGAHRVPRLPLGASDLLPLTLKGLLLTSP